MFDTEITIHGKAINQFEEIFFTEANGSLFKKQLSENVFRRYFHDTFEKKETLYFIVGSDSGLMPFYLLERFSNERNGRKFIVIDYQSVFDQVGTERFSELPSWIECYPATFPVPALGQLEIEYVASSRMQLVRSMSVLDAKAGMPYKNLADHFENEYQNFVFSENVTSVTKSFIDAQLMNLHANRFPVVDFQRSLDGKSVLMIGGGPSFDENLDWIVDNQDSLIIVAAGRMSKRLIKEGIVPDFIASVDPHDLSFDNAKDMLRFDDRTILLNCYHINPKLLNQWPHSAIYFGNALPWSNQENSASPGPTVIHSALHQVVMMGAKNIYFVGVDMCFFQGKTHASGTVESEIGKLGLRHAIKTVETYSGEIAETDQPFEMGVNNLEWLIKGYKEKAPDAKFYNLSNFAAKVVGVKYIPANEVDLNIATDKVGLMQNIKDRTTSSSQEWLEQQISMLAEVQKKHDALQLSSEICEHALKKVTAFSADDSQELRNELVNYKTKLDTNLEEMGEILYHYAISSFSDAFAPVEDENQMSQNEIARTLSAYFNGMKKAILDFIELLEKSEDLLKFRVKEWGGELSFTELAQEWINRFEVGRYQIWQKYHPDYKFNSEEQNLLNDLETRFENNLNNIDTTQAKLIKDRSINPVELHKKAEIAFSKQDDSMLIEILKQTEQIEGNDGQQLNILVEAMRLDLANEIEDAKTLYKQVTFPYFETFSFKRLLNFAMQTKNHEQALLYLEKLCQKSPDYIVVFADYLALLGQVAEAIQVLYSYLQENQSSISSWLKLAGWLQECGAFEDARYALNKVLLLDSDNKQALTMLDSLN